MRSCRLHHVAGVHSDVWHVLTRTHTHRHLHGGPLQRHSTTCTALSENATVHFSEECLSIQMDSRQTHTHTQMEGNCARPDFITPHVSLSAEEKEQLFSHSSWIKWDLYGHLIHTVSVGDLWGNKSWLEKHTYCTVIMNALYQQSCAYKPERSRKGARFLVAQLVFHELDQETAQQLRQKNTLLITTTIKIFRFFGEKKTKDCDRCSQQHSSSINAASLFPWERRDVRQNVDLEWNIQSSLVVVPHTPPFGTNISKVPNMVTSQST